MFVEGGICNMSAKNIIKPLALTKDTSTRVSTSGSTEIRATHTSELVIALCGPIGSRLNKVATLLETLLEERFNYECDIIKLSQFIEKHHNLSNSSPGFNRIKTLIAKGDELRKEYGHGILAELAIHQIAKERNKDNGDILLNVKETEPRKFEPRRVCHIIDSIKNQEELNVLKLVYQDMLYFIGVFSPLPVRQKNLENLGMSQKEVFELIDQDSGEEFAHGQTVRDTFPQADFFLRIDTGVDNPLKINLERFLNIIFKTAIATPTLDETAMYLAASSGGSSACLSRQVGAALTDSKGEVIAVGWNDVPKAGGNLYQYSADDPLGNNDKRCMNLDGGTCFNDLEKIEIANTIVNDLITATLIEQSKKDEAVKIIRKSKIKNLIEFSRAVHAEMHAIIVGSQLAGARVKNGKLYCTTYPCHACARHIIAAGIKEVFYIEPYRKSLATKLHNDSITEEETDDKKVRILPFNGVAPARYLQLFSIQSHSRKDGVTGKMAQYKPRETKPPFNVTLESIPVLEGIVVKNLVDKRAIGDPSHEESGV